LTKPSELTERHDENKRAADLRSLAKHLGVSDHPSSLRGGGGTRPRSQIKKSRWPNCIRLIPRLSYQDRSFMSGHQLNTTSSMYRIKAALSRSRGYQNTCPAAVARNLIDSSVVRRRCLSKPDLRHKRIVWGHDRQAQGPSQDITYLIKALPRLSFQGSLPPPFS
jgi:hypothetical protein